MSYSIKEKEPTLVWDIALRRKSQHWSGSGYVIPIALRRKSHWYRSGYVIKEKEPTLVCSDQDMSSYSIKEKEPTLVCSDQDMSYPYSIKEKEPTLVCSDQDIKEKEPTAALRRKSQHWFAQIRICHTQH